ncbi:MAG: hypothetical protein OXU73_00720 [Candidatus Campbellbacteria bacterium]|nr:hypothetical protein [Candidatus Campbellbacteria bacterium]
MNNINPKTGTVVIAIVTIIYVISAPVATYSHWALAMLSVVIAGIVAVYLYRWLAGYLDKQVYNVLLIILFVLFVPYVSFYLLQGIEYIF